MWLSWCVCWFCVFDMDEMGYRSDGIRDARLGGLLALVLPITEMWKLKVSPGSLTPYLQSQRQRKQRVLPAKVFPLDCSRKGQSERLLGSSHALWCHVSPLTMASRAGLISSHKGEAKSLKNGQEMVTHKTHSSSFVTDRGQVLEPCLEFSSDWNDIGALNVSIERCETLLTTSQGCILWKSKFVPQVVV